MVISPEIFAEYQRVGEILADEHPAINLKPVLEYIIQHAAVYATVAFPTPGWEDPDDGKFLACALSSGTGVVVGGDKRRLKVSGYHGIAVLKP